MLNSTMERSRRKLSHLRYAFEGAGLVSNGLKDIHLLHQALPELAVDEIKLNTTLCGLSMESPLIINAITGGAPEAESVNRVLAKIAKEFKLAMAVGSQTAGIDAPALTSSYAIVRDINPQGIILANVSANVEPEKALCAAEMLGANAIQLHLNVAQELIMVEGDRDFRNIVTNIRNIKKLLDIPVVVKEVGFGITREAARRLAETEVDAIDIGGAGGTNFAAIEAKRAGILLSDDLLQWGIPTAISLLEVLDSVSHLDIIAAGGIFRPIEVVKCMALGASAVGMAGWFLQTLNQGGETALRNSLDAFLKEIQVILALCGARDFKELKLKPLVILGEALQWCQCRGININKYAQRG